MGGGRFPPTPISLRLSPFAFLRPQRLSRLIIQGRGYHEGYRHACQNGCLEKGEAPAPSEADDPDGNSGYSGKRGGRDAENCFSLPIHPTAAENPPRFRKNCGSGGGVTIQGADENWPCDAVVPGPRVKLYHTQQASHSSAGVRFGEVFCGRLQNRLSCRTAKSSQPFVCAAVAGCNTNQEKIRFYRR